MNKPGMKQRTIFRVGTWAAVLILILMIATLVMSFMKFIGKAGEPVKCVATETPVVKTVNSSIDGTVEAAKCPTCIFGDATE